MAKKQIAITEENLPRFIDAHKKAVNADLEQFTFDGEFVLTTYAKYVIEYMNPQREPEPWMGYR